MEDGMLRFGRWFLLFIALAISFGQPSTRTLARHATPTTGSDPTVAPIDLQALVPRPSDIGSAYVNGGGTFSSVERYAAINKMTIVEVRRSGYVAQYLAGLALADGDAASNDHQEIQTLLSQYATTDFARAASQNLPLDEGWHEIESTLAIGEETRVSRGTGSFDGGTYEGIEIDFRVDTVAVRLSINNYDPNPTGGDAADEAGLGRVATIVADRIAHASERTGHSLSLRAVRLGAEDAVYANLDDTYEAIDGEVMRSFGTTAANYARLKRIAKNVVDLYQMAQATGPDQTAGTYLAVLARFADEASADAYVANHLDSVLENPDYGDVQVVSDARTYGDRSIVLSYRLKERDGAVVNGVRIVARRGTEVARLSLEGPTAPSLGTLGALTLDQLGCFQATACPSAIRLPPAA
jgi:hypothetical protein